MDTQAIKKHLPSVLLFGTAGLIAIGLIVFAAVHQNAAAPGMDAFAQCLTDKGAKMYGAWWCPHCAAQKEIFGSSFSKVNYVECSPNGSKTFSQMCQDTPGFNGTPTWIFSDGSALSGEQTLQALGDKTGCALPTVSS